MAIHLIKPGTFIYLIDDALTNEECDTIVDMFESYRELQYRGVTGGGYKPETKKTWDISVKDVLVEAPEFQQVDDILYNSLNRALKQFNEMLPMNNDVGYRGFDLDAGYLLQRYDPPAGQYKWHSDEGFASGINRQITALWYLNDVPYDHGGATDFFDQKIGVQPEKGKMVIFPACWTHLHRGAPVVKGKKYIATTWVGLPAVN